MTGGGRAEIKHYRDLKQQPSGKAGDYTLILRKRQSAVLTRDLHVVALGDALAVSYQHQGSAPADERCTANVTADDCSDITEFPKV